MVNSDNKHAKYRLTFS